MEELDFSLIRTSNKEWWSLEETAAEWHYLLSRSIPSTIYKVVQVYAPTSTHEDEEVEEFYEEVSKIMSESKSYYKIVIEDFNAKAGGHQRGDGAAVG